MDNTEYLKQLSEAEKKNKQLELEQAKAAALQSIQQQEATTMPTFTAKKQQANVASQLGAKNLAEYWANRGQTNAGISAQAELSRGNVLGNTLNTIGQSEAAQQQAFNTGRTDIETGFQNNLINANNAIDTQLQQNLYNERIRAQEEAYKKKQDAIANSQAWARINESKKSNQLPEGSSFAQNGVAYQILNGRAVPINYAVKSTTKDLATGKTTTQYTNQKQYDYNKQGYWLNNAASTIKFGTGKKATNYKQWYNQNDGKSYIIAYDIKLPLTGNETNGKDVIKNAYTSGAITKKQLKTLTTKFGY